MSTAGPCACYTGHSRTQGAFCEGSRGNGKLWIMHSEPWREKNIDLQISDLKVLDDSVVFLSILFFFIHSIRRSAKMICCIQHERNRSIAELTK